MLLSKQECTSEILRSGIKLVQFLGSMLMGMLVLGNQPACGQSKANADSLIYTVQPGDYLVKIAVRYGSPGFWQPIYDVNRERIKDPDLIEPGQKLIIPAEVLESKKITGKREPAEERENKHQKELKAFRKAFDQIVQREKNKEEAHPEISDNGLEFGGLIINETRSKLGKDFFNIFYQFWEAPEGAPNFLLTVSERPIPGMGALVSINLDNQPIYRSKLQPRNAVIEQQARKAVAVSHQALRQHMQTTSDITIY